MNLKGKTHQGKGNTALRFWVAGSGGPCRSGARVTIDEQRAIETYVKDLDFKRFWNQDPLKIQDKGFKKLGILSSSRYTYRNELKNFIVFCQIQGWDPRQKRVVKRQRMRNVNGVRQPSTRRLNWQRADKIQLAKHESPPSLNAEMQAFKEFYVTTLGLSPKGYDEGFIRRYLGMLVQEGTPLSEISLEKLVPYARSSDNITMTEIAQGRLFPENPVLKVALSEGRYFEALAVAKELCREQEQTAIAHVIQLIDNYGKYTKCQSNGRRLEITWLLRVVKFVYRHDARANEAFEELPVVKALRRKNRKFAERVVKEKPRVSYEEKSLTRYQVLGLIHTLKIMSMQKKGTSYHKLNLCTRALNMQIFLVAGLLSLVPPRRYRVLRELEIGRTLCRGLRIGKRFVPEADLPHDQQARWYYYLSVEDYKTGKYKGDSWTPIPDWEFNDGTHFYEYIDIWLNELRPQLNPSCNHFFVSTGYTVSKRGTPTERTRIREWIKQATADHTGIAVPPKEFRKMFVSYVKSLPDITEAELEAIAAAMGHSRQMQEQVYNQLGHDETVSPVIDFQKRINESYLDDIG